MFYHHYYQAALALDSTNALRELAQAKEAYDKIFTNIYNKTT
jgi:hypothetical protein